MSDNPERCANYLKIIRLIVDVGTDTVRDLFYFYKPKERVAAFFASHTILDELFDLKRRHVITSEQFEKLTNDPNPDEIDISLLITILVNLFKWTVGEPENGWNNPIAEDDATLGADLLRLKKLRNSLVGHSPDGNISNEVFEDLWEQTSCILTRIADITHSDTITVVIERYKSSPLDKNDDKNIPLLRQWYEESMSAISNLQRRVEELCEKTNETKNKLKQAVEQMRREGADFGSDHVVELKMMTHGKTEEKQKLAENILFTVWQKAMSLSDDPGNFEAIEEAVNRILEGIKHLPNVKVATVERHCIIVNVVCSFNLGLLQLLDFIESVLFTECMQSLSQSLSAFCGEEIVVTAFCGIESLLETMSHIRDKEVNSSTVSVKVKCSTVDAVRRFQQMAQDDKTTNTMHSIAQALTEDLGEKISIDTSVDVKGLDALIDEECIYNSTWPTYGLFEVKGNSRHGPFYEDHFRRIVADIKYSKSYLHARIKEKNFPRSKSLPDLLHPEREFLDNTRQKRQHSKSCESIRFWDYKPEEEFNIEDFLSLAESLQESFFKIDDRSKDLLWHITFSDKLSDDGSRSSLGLERSISRNFGSSSSFGSFASGASHNSSFSVF